MWNFSTMDTSSNLCCGCILDVRHVVNKHTFPKLNVNTNMDDHMKSVMYLHGYEYW
jgi:hypothetical protein